MLKRYILLIFAAWVLALPLCLPAPSESSMAERVHSLMATLPLAFELNSGQAPRSVRFLARGLTQKVTLSESGASVFIVNPGTRKTAVLSLELIAARRHARIEGQIPSPGVYNYFHASDRSAWKLHVPTYTRVRYCEVYPGIDLIFRGDQGRIEYDFVIKPFADPQRIRLRWLGADTIQLSPAGDLVLRTAAGEVHQKKPHIYQEVEGRHVDVAGTFVWKTKNELGLQLGTYDRSSRLIVDPLIYTVQLPLPKAFNLAVDPAGNAYVAITAQDVFPTTPRSLQPFFAGGSCGGALPPLVPFPCDDVFVMKFNAAGNQLIYATYLAVRGGTPRLSGAAVSSQAMAL